jgi:hypothetical protein
LRVRVHVRARVQPHACAHAANENGDGTRLLPRRLDLRLLQRARLAHDLLRGDLRAAGGAEREQAEARVSACAQTRGGGGRTRTHARAAARRVVLAAHAAPHAAQQVTQPAQRARSALPAPAAQPRAAPRPLRPTLNAAPPRRRAAYVLRGAARPRACTGAAVLFFTRVGLG